jgi:hypothetical protein
MTNVAFGILIALVVYALLSVAVAVATIDKCQDMGRGKQWNLVPPRWDCTGLP